MQNNATYRIYENGVDQLFGSKLEHYQMPDAVGDWNDLQHKLDNHDRKKKKPAYGKWALGLLLLAGITTGAVYLLSPSGTSKKEQYAQQTGAATTTTANNAVKDNTNTQNTPAANNEPATNDFSAANNPSNTATETPKQNIQPNNTSNGNVNTPADDDRKAANYVPSQTINNNNAVPYRKQSQFINTVKTNRNRNAVANETFRNRSGRTRTAPVPDEPLTVSNNSNENERNSGKAEIAGNNKTETTAGNEETATETTPLNPEPPKNNEKNTVTETPAAANENNASGSIMNTLTANEPAAATTGTKKTKVKKTRVRKEAPDHDFTSNEGKWYIEAFSGYNNSVKDNKSFAAFLAPAGYVEKRLKQENALVSLQAGVNFKFRKNHFIFGTGLSYLELGDMVRYDAQYSGAVALNANGRSKLTYLEIPISAGYDWANKRWGFSLQGGISAGMLLGAKGQYVSASSFNSGLFDLGEHKSIFRKTQLNLLVTPSVNYFLNEKTNVFISPLYRLNLQPVTVAGASLNQKYYGMGLRIGIRTSLR